MNSPFTFDRGIGVQASESPEELRYMVTSPGGTTAAAIAHLKDGQFTKLFASAVSAAARRSKELADFADAPAPRRRAAG